MHTSKELLQSEVKVKRIISAYNDLKDQADFYGLDIDLETLELTPKRNFTTPKWYERWVEKRSQMDLSEYNDMERQ